MPDDEILEEEDPIEEEPEEEKVSMTVANEEAIKKDIKDELGKLALEVWGDIAPTIPGIITSIVGPTEVVLQGKYKDETKAILKKMEGDLIAFKNKEIDRIEFTDLVGRRKAAVYALYNANKIANQRPSIQKVLCCWWNLQTISVEAHRVTSPISYALW